VDIEKRLLKLKSEREQGRQMLSNLQNQIQQVQIEIFKLDGKISVLEELLKEQSKDDRQNE
jgi:predicted  nucleic acid-binding Zn-ribbon protein